MTEKTKIQLVFPQGGSKLSSSGVLPPLGIVSLATYLKKTDPSIDVELFDGEMLDKENITSKLDGNLLGLSVTGANYHNALELAREAKKKGLKVVLGGPQATVRHRQILANRDFIDAVIRGDGEKTFHDYIVAVRNENPGNLAGIKGLSYKDADGSIIVNSPLRKCDQIGLDVLPAPDYGLLGKMLELYKGNFRHHAYAKEGYTRFASIESQKGCAKTERESDRKGRCSFCARIDKGLRRLAPQEFWLRVQELHDIDGMTMIWDVSDSFSGSVSGYKHWLQEVARCKPSDLEDKVNFKIFARADEMDKKTVSYLQQIGVAEVFMGVESGSQERLDAANKSSSVEDNLKAVKALKKSGIRTYTSLVYGLRGEDSESLEQTHDHVQELLDNGDIAGIGARILFPMAGSTDYNRLEKQCRKTGNIEFADRMANADFMDIGELQRAWLDNMTHTDIEEITHYHRRIMDLAKSYDVRINDEERLIIS